MPGGGNDDGSVDGVGIHARLIVVVHSNEGPVRDDTGNADVTVGHLAGDEILNGGGVEELDVGKGEDFGQRGGSEEGLGFHIVSRMSTSMDLRETSTYSMLHNDEIPLVLERNPQIVEKSLGRLPHDHGTEELATEPSPAAGRHGSLDDGNLEVGTCLCKHVSCAQTTRSGTNDHDVGFGVVVEVLEITTGHGTRDLRLANRREFEALVPVVCHVGQGLGLGLSILHSDDLRIEARFQVDARFQIEAVGWADGLSDCGWGHFE